MKREPKKVGTLGAVLIFLLILVVMLVGKLVLKFDTAILLMFVSMITSAIFIFYYGYDWDKMFKDGVVPMTSRAMGAMIILLTVGILIAIWIISGTIPYLMYIGLKSLSPKVFLVAAAIITSVSSLLTGTSWGTGATFGVALMGVAYGLGVPLPIAAGAIVVGSYLGDKISPVSDTTVLAAAVAEVDVIDHIKSMLWTTTPGYILSLIVYAIIGVGVSGTIDYSQVNSILTALQQNFKLNPLTLIP
ncbi:MAG: Na+/H+ antiporter NhaC, partial [Euryarchaeota archaeon]|nr:Na+/H+ antiporter NhaC [Euryarchaeota archaeon]